MPREPQTTCCELAQLAAKHGVQLEAFRPLPLSPPTGGAQTLTGFAATSHLDADRTKFLPFAFGLVNASRVRLLFKHDARVPAGTVEELRYDERGNLRIRCRVDHVEGRRLGAFSIGGRILSYKIHNADRPDFYAEVDAATLEGVSVTDIPANRSALVTSRFPADARSKYLGDLQNWVGVFKQMVNALQVAAADAATPSEGAMMHKAASRRWPSKGDYMVGGDIWNASAARAPSPRPKSSFSELAQELNSRLMEA